MSEATSGFSSIPAYRCAHAGYLLFNAPIRACIAKSRLVASFVERSRPIRKTVLAAPPPVHRRLAPFASKAADINARLPFLRSVVHRLAGEATEKDTQWNSVRH